MGGDKYSVNSQGPLTFLTLRSSAEMAILKHKFFKIQIISKQQDCISKFCIFVSLKPMTIVGHVTCPL